jgi:hypothetical protein
MAHMNLLSVSRMSCLAMPRATLDRMSGWQFLLKTRKKRFLLLRKIFLQCPIEQL